MIPKMWNEYTFKNAHVQKFIKQTGLEFDVVVAEDFVSESVYYFAYKHNAPLVTICPFGSTDFIDHQQGLINPPSFVTYTVGFSHI